MIYQILGWPRSRTAWLSAFLTTDNTFCFHEGVGNLAERRLRTVPEYKKLIRLFSEHYEHVGDANTVALAQQKYVIPGARVVVIERDHKEILDSLAKKDLYAEIPKVIEYPYNELLIVKYKDIDKRLAEIWSFCLPGVKFSSTRAKLFKQMNIQVRDIYSYINLGV